MWYSKEDIESLRKELKPTPEIKQLNLSHYIEVQKKEPKFKIGVLGPCPPNFSNYVEGDFVLYEPYTIEEVYGDMLSKDIERYIQKCTVSKPSRRYFENESRISTVGTSVGFPLKYIAYEIVV